MSWLWSLFSSISNYVHESRIHNKREVYISYQSDLEALRKKSDWIPIWEGLGGLVVRPRPLGRRAPGPKPDSTEDPPCMRPAARQLIRSQTSSRWCGMERGCQLRCRPRHLTVAQNY
ncbi:hypothetical protein AVEN_94673-1 [Araneus ventricosus]|uniref:Uncharacterized protein n=1 Tax=Araneus ventricosus TaxID=182803 RepID=A0A4Y2SM02_ARAVE|nr:hypothetical protein AVEN_94673-1 [Araneus ventricosus]